MGTKFNSDSKAKTRCYIYNNSTKKTMRFQYNPTNLSYERSANYSTISSPGISYPLTQYTGGNIREFTVSVFYYDKPCTGKIAQARAFLEALLPPENNSNFTKPPSFKFAMGYFVKTCVLTKLKVTDDLFDTNGNPVMTTFELSLRQVGK